MRAVTVEDNDRLVDEASLTFDDPDGKGADLFVPDKTLTVALGWDEENAVLFEGVVVDRHPVAGADGKRSVTVVARDLSHRMSQTPVTGEFQPGTLETVVREVAKRNNWTGDLATITCDPNPQLTEHNDLKQVNETDYHYLQRLAERYGARAFVEYNDGKSRFYFVSNRSLLEGKPLGTLEYCRGLNKLIEFKYSSVAARSAKQYVANAVDPVTGDVKTAQGDPATPPPAAPTASPPPPRRRRRPPRPGGLRSGSRAACRRHRPDTRTGAARGGTRRRDGPPAGEGQGHDRRPRPVGGGRLVRIEGDPHLERHADARRPEGEAEARLLRDEVQRDAVTMLRSDLNRHAGKFYGKYSGSVVDIADTDQLGRVKVSVPSVYGPNIQDWARPCFSPGHFFVPPVGAAVWVEFEAGDPSYPLWVGTWYPTGTIPPEADKPSATGRVVHTPAGHLVELSDENGKEKLVIRHMLDSFVSIDEKGSVLAANQKGSYLYLNADKAEVSVTSEQGHMVTLGSEGVVAVHSGGSRIEIADGKVKLTGTSSVQIVAQEVSIAGGSLALGGSAQDPAELGNGLMAMYNAHTHASAVGPTGPPIPPLTPGPPVFSLSVKVQP